MQKVEKDKSCPVMPSVKAGNFFCSEKCPWNMGYVDDRKKEIQCSREIVKK